MSFKNMETNTITIKNEDADYVYFSMPPKVRVAKSTGKIEKYMKKAGWVNQPLFKSISDKKDPRYPGSLRICKSQNGKSLSFSAARVIATALIPNPNGLTFVRTKDGNPANISPDNLEWCNRDTMFIDKRYTPFTEEELEALKSIPYPHDQHNKEYMYFLNHRTDEYGMTKADRSRYRRLGRLETEREARVRKNNQNSSIDMTKSIHDAAMDLLTAEPRYDSITHVQIGFFLPTPSRLEELIKESKCPKEVAEEARVILREIAVKILNETSKNEATLKAALGDKTWNKEH